MLQRLAVVSAALTFAACSTENVQVPNEIQSSGKKIAFTWSKGISGKDPVHIAPFKADKMDIGWASSSGSTTSVSAFSSGEKSTEQKYKFTMIKDGSPLTVPVECSKTGQESGMALGGIKLGGASTSKLDCSLTIGADKARLLGEGVGGGFKGKVESVKGSKEILFEPIFTSDKGSVSKTPLGYQLVSDGKKSAVINLGPERAYWYIPQNEDAADLNLAATAISLFISAQ